MFQFEDRDEIKIADVCGGQNVSYVEDKLWVLHEIRMKWLISIKMYGTYKATWSKLLGSIL